MGNKLINWLKNIGAALFVVISLIQIWDWFMSPAPDLVAEIESGPFEYPPGLIDSLKSRTEISRLMDSFYRDIFSIKRCLSVTRRNEGEKPVKSVTLKLPYVVYVRIHREDEAPVSKESSELVKIDVIHPDEEIKLIAWLRYESPFPYKIRLTHESGVETIVIRAPVDPFWQNLAEHLSKYWVLYVLLIIILPIFIYMIYIELRNE